MIIAFFLLITNLQAQHLNERGGPFIHNYKPSDYGGSAQNWAVLQDKRGVMYFGSSAGLGVLEFDGKYWRTIPMPNHSTVRSLAMDENGTIYVGAVGEFGYLAVDNTGKSTYVSLSDRLSEQEKNFKHVWGTQVTTHGVYFQTREKIFRFYKEEIDSVTIPAANSTNDINDAVIVNIPDKGFHILKEGQLQFLPHTENLTMESSAWHIILPYDENKMLVVIEHKGIYTYDISRLLHNGSFISDFSKAKLPATVLERLPTEIEEFLRFNDVSAAARVNDYCYAFGTNKGGIVMMDRTGKLIQVINIRRGLRSDNVRYLYVDRDQNLWAALNDGIALIEISSPITQFNERNGVKANVLSMIRYQGTAAWASINFVSAAGVTLTYEVDWFETVSPS